MDRYILWDCAYKLYRDYMAGWGECMRERRYFYTCAVIKYYALRCIRFSWNGPYTQYVDSLIFTEHKQSQFDGNNSQRIE